MTYDWLNGLIALLVVLAVSTMILATLVMFAPIDESFDDKDDPWP